MVSNPPAVRHSKKPDPTLEKVPPNHSGPGPTSQPCLTDGNALWEPL